MREELRSHKLMLGFIVGWIIIFLSTLVSFGAHKADVKLEAGVVLVLTSVVGAALSYVGMSGIVAAGIFGKKHRREFLAYITLGMLALVMATILMFSTDESIAILCLGAAPFPLLLGLAEIRLAMGFTRHQQLSHALIVCGLLELTCGVLLACARFFDELQVMSIIAATAFISLLQLVPFLFFQPVHFHSSPE